MPIDDLRIALYYPHSSLTNERLIKRSLLLYDQVEVIVPTHGWPWVPDWSPAIEGETRTKVLEEAMELIGVRRVIDKEVEQKQIHDEIARLLANPLPEWFRFEMSDPGRYEIFPEKLLPGTWEILQNAGVTWQDMANQYHDYVMHPSLGLAIMGIVARICAGTTREKITDRVDAHRAYMHYIAATSGGAPEESSADAAWRMETVKLPGIDLSSVPLQKLIAFRRDADSDPFRKKLRRNFQEALTDFRSNSNDASPNEYEELKRQFETKLTEDVEYLEKMLQLKRGDLAVKAIVAALNLRFGDFLEGIAKGLELFTPLPGFRLEQQAAMEDNSSAWLYLAGKA